jgi:hypothetical protein
VSPQRKTRQAVPGGKRNIRSQRSSTANLSRSSKRGTTFDPSGGGLRLAKLALFASLALITGMLWLSVEYLLNPDVAFWLDAELFGARQGKKSTVLPQTIPQIQTALKKVGLTAGQPIVLKQNFALQPGVKTATDLVLPVLVKDNIAGCSVPCQRIDQLRLYQALQLPLLIRIFQRDAYFRLIDAIPVRGPSAADLTALDQNPLVSDGSNQPLPLTQSELYTLAPQPGLWLKLVGLRTQGNSVATYGQVLYFNPVRERLDLMANWVSPPGDVPQWQQVTGDALPELVVDQTVGTEPQYMVYQLSLANGAAAQLRPIALTAPTFADGDYAKALSLARSGLWTAAQQRLTQVKKDFPKRWTAAAQAQLDYIRLHANVALVQRIMGYLANGSWNSALTVLRSDRAARAEVREMLVADSGRLASRIDAALRNGSNDASLVIWGALFRSIRTSEAEAITWAKQQTSSTDTQNQVKFWVKYLAKAKPVVPGNGEPNTLPATAPQPSPAPALKSSPIISPSPSLASPVPSPSPKSTPESLPETTGSEPSASFPSPSSETTSEPTPVPTFLPLQ